MGSTAMDTKKKDASSSSSSSRKSSSQKKLMLRVHIPVSASLLFLPFGGSALCLGHRGTAFPQPHHGGRQGKGVCCRSHRALEVLGCNRRVLRVWAGLEQRGGPVGWELRVLPAASSSEDNSAVGSLLVVWLGEKPGHPQTRGSAAPALALGTVRALWLNQGAQPDAAVAQNQPGAEFPRARELGF